MRWCRLRLCFSRQLFLLRQFPEPLATSAKSRMKRPYAKRFLGSFECQNFLQGGQNIWEIRTLSQQTGGTGSLPGLIALKREAFFSLCVQ
jgi:hypothetical protein